MPNTDAAPDSLRIFRENWRVYRKLVDHNYMFHRELADEARSFLHAHFADRSLSVLDLGCGDCSQTGALFRGLTIRRYAGYDLSRPALDLAEDNLAGLACEVRLDCKDMLDALRTETPGYDLIFSGFALHHLDAAGKRAFFRAARGLLNPDGALLLIDIARTEDQDRERYVDAYLDHAERAWTALEPEEFELIRAHVAPSDFPETVDEYGRMARAGGFPDLAAGAAHTWHRALFFRTGPA